MAAVNDIGLTISYHLLKCKDSTTNRLLVGDAGAKVSGVPCDLNNLIVLHSEVLWAAKGTGTPRHRHSSLPLGFGSFPIISIDLPLHLDLLVDVRHRIIVDRQTSLAVTGSYAVVNQITQMTNSNTASHFAATRKSCISPVQFPPSLLGQPTAWRP